MATQVPPEQDQGDDERGSARESTHQEVANKSVVAGVPTYNEEVAIGTIVVQAKRYADEVVVVDDGSSDDTVQIALEAGATVIEHEVNRGKGGAIRTLMRHVRDEEDVDALVVLDGDGQHLPEDIADVADPVLEGECDVSIGSRYVEQEETETPLHRRFGQRVLDYLTLGSSGENLSDTQSGFRALSPDAVSRLNLRTDGMGVESEMINEAVDHDLEIEEVPIDVRYEGVDGQTHNPFKHGLSVAVFILQLIRDRHPLLFFGVPGFLVLLTGGLLAIQTASLYQTTGAFHQWRILLSSFLTIIGTLGLFCGLILSQISNMVEQGNG